MTPEERKAKREYDRIRNQRAEVKHAKSEQKRAHFSTPEGRKEHRDREKAARSTPEGRAKYLARMKANYALRSGKITRKACGECGNIDSHMHHDDYSKPLEVRWFCHPCHMKLFHSPALQEMEVA